MIINSQQQYSNNKISKAISLLHYVYNIRCAIIFVCVCSLCFTALFRLCMRQCVFLCVFAFFKLFSYFFLSPKRSVYVIVAVVVCFFFYSHSIPLHCFYCVSIHDLHLNLCMRAFTQWMVGSCFFRAIIVPEHFYFFLLSFTFSLSLPLFFSLSFGRPFKFFDTIPIKPHLHFLPLSFHVCVYVCVCL